MPAKSSNFTEKVYAAVKKIKKGNIATYKEIAKSIGNPNAYRAVGNALNKNTSSAVPCHRIIKEDMSIGGFNKGNANKIRLLKSEGAIIKDGKAERRKTLK